MMDDNFTDSAAFYYLCDMTPPRPLHDADMGTQGLPGFYPSNVDSFPQGSQMRQPSNAQLYQNGDRSENITHNPGDLSGEALPDAKTQWERETVPRSCEGQYQEQWGVPQLVQSREREQLEGGAQKYVTRGSLLSRGVHLNNVQNFPSGSNHLNNLNSSAALLNPVNVDSRVNALSTSRKITLTSMHHKSMKPALPLKKIPGIGLHLNSVVSSFGGNSVQDARPNELQARQNMGGPKPVSIIRNHNLRDKIEMNPISSNVADHALANNAVSPQQQLKEIAQSNPQNISSTPSRKRNFSSEQTDSNEQLYQSSPNALGQSSGEGCKRCNCVRTKCLKLYCDCFAAGLYCAGPCACQGCYNKPEYEDKLTEARRQIEFRNPIAFAPKVLQKDEELTPPTPSSSARHRRGCNCKKSMCTKKYCECYKEGVGCSEGCRCEGCQNEYGRKESIDHGYSEDVAGRRVSHGKEALGSKPLPTPYHPSACSDLTISSSSARIPTSPSHSSSDKHKERADSSSQCYEPITVCESMKKKNPPSQSHEQTVALNDSNHLANVPSSVAASASERKNCIGASSIRWQRSSLVTQIVPIGERLNLQGFNSHAVFDKLEDAPSEILKESMPVIPADVDSPIRKRVRLQDLCSNSPVEFKSGRKYILKAVGTSTPLKPCNYQNKADNTQADETR